MSSKTWAWAMWEIAPEPEPTCGVKRGPRAKTTCEYPAGHPGDAHIGRDQAGRWHVWVAAHREREAGDA